MSEENVKVAVRVRPFNRREKDRNASLIIGMNGATTTIDDPSGTNEQKKFTFDFSYWSHDGCKEDANGYFAPDSSHPNGKKFADQNKVYDQLGAGILSNAWEGYNSTLFAYGQTGSGKSWSIVGYGVNKGIVPKYTDNLFKQIEEKKGGETEFEVTFSMLEIYNEQVRDLLDSRPNKAALKVRQHPKLGFYPDNLQTVAVANYAEIEQRIEQGTTNRTVASTKMNATSSRAHTIVGITFVQKSKNAAGEMMAKSAVCNLVDLAGSERAESTGATGDRLKEGAAINQSLSSLGNCIAALADRAGGKQTRVPYRDSQLTKLLKNALGGNSKTIMIAALSPADINYDETLSTLRYADRAKQIKTTAKVNEDPTEKLIRELQEENEKLKAMLASGGKIDPSMLQGDDDEELTEEDKKEMEEDYKSIVQKNQQEMDEMKKTFEERLKEAQMMGGVNLEEREKMKAGPHLYNLNADPQMTGHIIHPMETDDKIVIGNGKDPETDLTLRGVSIKDKHCIIWHKGDEFLIETFSDAVTLRNGKEVTSETKVLKHNDRLLFGTSQFYVFQHPKFADQAKVKEVTYEMAQEEIATKSAGLDISGKDKERDALLLQYDLLDIMPKVAEANGDSEMLGKNKSFEMVIVQPECNGVLNSRSEVMVRMTDTNTKISWMWDKAKAINRIAVMNEMADLFQDEEKWDKPQDQDPFYEDPNAVSLIGSAKVWLKSLAFNIESSQQLELRDYFGNVVGTAQIDLLPCDPKGKEYTEKDDKYVDDPSELVGKPVSFKIKVVNARGLPNKYTDVFCQYKFYLDETVNKSKVIPNTVNPDLNFDKIYDYPNMTQQALDYLKDSAFILQIMGKQKAEKPGAGGKMKSMLAKKGSTMQAVGSTEKKFDSEKMMYMMEVATLKKRHEKMEQKMAHMKKMLEEAQKHNKKRISVMIVSGVYNASTADQADKCIKMIATEKGRSK